MKVLVTGAAGFVGSYITERLINDNYDVNILDSCIFNKNLNDEVISKTNYFEGDIRDEDLVSEASSGCDIIFHFAALVGVDAYSKSKVLTMEIEGDGLKNICKYIKIQYSNTLMNSTYHGKKWWGDAISGKYLDGLNPNFKNKINMSFFSTN